MNDGNKMNREYIYILICYNMFNDLPLVMNNLLSVGTFVDYVYIFIILFVLSLYFSHTTTGLIVLTLPTDIIKKNGPVYERYPKNDDTRGLEWRESKQLKGREVTLFMVQTHTLKIRKSQKHGSWSKRLPIRPIVRLATNKPVEGHIF